MPPSKSLPLTASRMSSAIAARDQAKADQLAPSHFDGPHHNAAIRATAMCGVRRSSALGYAVADGGRAGQAAGAQRVIIRRGALGNSVKQLQQKIGTF